MKFDATKNAAASYALAIDELRRKHVMESWPFGYLKPMHYRAIMVDPPWTFSNWSAKGEAKNPKAHYECQGVDWIKALPVGHLAAPDCLLWLWACAPLLDVAFDVMKAWGFQFKTAGAWHKTTTTGKTAFGTGYIMRSAMEPYLIGTIGKPRILSRSIRNLIVAERREHSRKPDEAYTDLERLTDAPRCELFSRMQRNDWDCWGDQL